MAENCAFCQAEDTSEIDVAPRDDVVALCAVCREGVTGTINDGPHWQCLNDAIWGGVAPVQVLAWRLLHKLRAPWANDLLEIAYLEPDVMEWAEAVVDDGAPDVVHRDSNGVVLSTGDNVMLIKDLPVKGAGFTAKRGTAVRGISLVGDNEDHIEGRVEGQRIVILTKFVKKS